MSLRDEAVGPLQGPAAPPVAVKVAVTGVLLAIASGLLFKDQAAPLGGALVVQVATYWLPLRQER